MTANFNAVALVRKSTPHVVKVLHGLHLPIEIMRNCKLLPDRDIALSLLPKGGIMAEVGVAYGDFSRKIIDNMDPHKFYAIDVFSHGPGREFWGRADFADSNMGQIEFIEKKFANEIETGKVVLKKGFSWNILETFDDNYFDCKKQSTGYAGETIKGYAVTSEIS